MNTPTLRPFVALKIVTFLALALCAGCNVAGIGGNHHVVTETRPVADFTDVDADGMFQIEWTNGPASLQITTDQNLLKYIDTSVREHTLRIHARENLRPSRGLKIYLASSGMTGARISGAVRFTASRISGKGFYLQATGATRVTLDGNVPELLATMSGASKLEAGSLQTKDTELSIAGAGNANVAASEVLKVAISGAGKVVYSGNPRIERKISGAGSIRPRD